MDLKYFHSLIGGMMKWTSSMPDMEVLINVDEKLYPIAMVGGGGSTRHVNLYARTESLSARLAIVEGRASAEELEADNQNHRDALAAIAALNLPKTDAETNTPQQDHLPKQKPPCDLPSDDARKRETSETEHR